MAEDHSPSVVPPEPPGVLAAEAAARPLRADELMAVLAHDLRNPIAVVRVSAQMAVRQVDRGDLDAARGRLAAIVQQTDRLSELLERFLDAARVNDGRIALRLEPVRLANVVRIAGERASAGTAARPLVVDVPPDCVGLWDAGCVRAALQALVENALAYGNPSQPVQVRAAVQAAKVVVTITGGGAGPAPGEADRLFQPFFRGHAAVEVGHSGPGLGLYTARGIARAHGGDVRPARDGPPDAFELELPLQARPPAPPA